MIFIHITNFFRDPAKILTLSAIVSLVMTILHAFFCFEMYDDVASAYAPAVRELGRLNWSEGFPIDIPPLQPFIAGLLAIAGVEAFTSSIIISGLLYAATIWPLYKLMGFLMDRKLAAWGCLMYVLAPKVIRYGCSGMLNSGKNFFTALTIYAIFECVKNGGKRWFVILGAAMAGLTLIRAEGLIFTPLALASVLALSLHDRQWKTDAAYCRRITIQLLISIITFTILLSPRIAQVYHHTGIPFPDARITNITNYFFSFHHENRRQTPDITLITPAAITEKTDKVESRFAIIRSPGNFIKNWARGAYELYLLAAAIGLAFVIKRKTWIFKYNILLAFMILNTAVFAAIWLDYRYFIPNLILFMPFTVYGLNECLRLAARIKFGNIIAAIAMTIIAISQITNGLEKIGGGDKTRQKDVAEWIISNRHTFVQHDRKPVICARQPQYAFWADTKSATLHKNIQYPDRHLLFDQNFDVLVLERRKCKSEIALSSANPQLEEIKHPWHNTIAIFRKISPASKKE